MTLLDEWKQAKDLEETEKYNPLKQPKGYKTPRCPLLDEMWICKISRDFVEKGKRDTLFRCICSEFYVNCDIYKKYWRSGGENEIE